MFNEIRASVGINEPLQILLVEDNAADAYLLKKFLSTLENMALSHVECLREAIARLRESHFDAILLDLSLPDSRGLNTVREIHTADSETPILVLTGLNDEESAIAALREGAQDYLIKGEIQRNWLIRAIHYAIERQQNFEKLQHLNKELIRSNQELEQFAYVVSHDLREPLQSILGCAELLSMIYRNSDHQKANKYIGAILNASKHMAELIQDLLVYSQVATSKEATPSTDCNQVVEQVLSNLQPMIKECHAAISWEILPAVAANETELVQLFQNLLSNAIKYRRLDQSPHIQISAELQQNQWCFSIKDNGIGIDSEYFDRIFQIFQRLHSKQEYPGTGIGLATCKKIVEYNGGCIWIES